MNSDGLNNPIGYKSMTPIWNTPDGKPPIQGVALLDALLAATPKPTHDLKWGEDIPKAVMEAMANGETALLRDEFGKPHSIVLRDYSGTIRQRRVFFEEECQ